MMMGQMVNGEIRVDAMDVAREQTVRLRITGAKRLAFRMQIVRWLIGIASRLIGCRIVVIED